MIRVQQNVKFSATPLSHIPALTKQTAYLSNIHNLYSSQLTGLRVTTLHRNTSHSTCHRQSHQAHSTA